MNQVSSRNYLGDGDDSLDDSMIERMYAAAATTGGKTKKKAGAKLGQKARPGTAAPKPPQKITEVGKQAQSRLFDYKSGHEEKAKTL